MRIAILGAGAMGSLFGGLLAEAGNDVTLIEVDAARVDAIRSNGLLLDTDAGQRRVKLRAVPSDAAVEVPGLVIAFTKSQHTREALAGIGHLLGADTHVLTLQNGLGNREAIVEFVPVERVLIGVTTIPADLVGPGHVRSHGAGSIRLMSADSIARPVVETVAASLNAAGLETLVDPRVPVAIWEKLAFNAALNSVCAVSGCTVGEVAALADGRALALTIAGETVAVARAAGIEANPEAVAETVNAALDKHGGHQPSMLQDVLAGRRTEIEAINGAVVRAARKWHVQVPHTETLLTLMRLVESRRPEAAQRSAPDREP